MNYENNIPFVDAGAQWIWSAEGCSLRMPNETGNPYELRRFRRQFVLAKGSKDLHFHISADSRYLFFWDGVCLGRGPAHGDVRHQFFDTYQLSAAAGVHTLAVLVLDYSPVQCDPPRLGAPAAIMTRHGGLVCEMRDGKSGECLLCSDESWRVSIAQSLRFQPGKLEWFGGFVGHFEHFLTQAEQDPEWMRPDFDDSNWPFARALYAAERFERQTDASSPYGLMERIIPFTSRLPDEQPQAVFLPGGDPAASEWQRLVAGDATVCIEAGGSVEVLVELRKQWTGFPRIAFAGGQGAVIRVGYAEALRLSYACADATILGRGIDTGDVAIGFADEGSGWTFDHRGSFEGFEDIIEADGREWDWSPCHWRTAKFIRLRIETGSEPLTLQSFAFTPCHYPLQEAAPFRCDNPMLEQIHATSVHTLKLCVHETFVDCPYYEQLQYIGDSALNAQVVMLLGGAYPLVKQLLLHFDWSRVPEGWTQSRYPSRIEGIIPAQSLDWVGAAHAYALQSGDLVTVKSIWPGINVVLDAYERHCQARGLPWQLPYWNWVDWCPGWKRGVPPGAEAGPVLSHAAKYGIALRQAEMLAGWLNLPGDAAALGERWQRLRQAARNAFLSNGRFAENTVEPGYASRLGNAYALLAGFHKPSELDTLRAAIASDQLSGCSYFGQFFVRQALWESGGCDLSSALIDWERMVDYGLTTWAEDTFFWRSLCHGWSANPIVDFLTRILGVQPLSPGFDRARICPAIDQHAFASGAVMTPKGAIVINWKDHGEEITITIPAGIEAVLALPGRREALKLPVGKHRVTGSKERANSKKILQEC